MSMKSIKQFLTSSDEPVPDSEQESSGFYRSRADSIERQARYLAEQICSGFQLHDRRQHSDAVEAFHAVDRDQFAHLSTDEAYDAAEAYVDALWAKDEIEKRYTGTDGIDAEAIAAADYSSVRESLERRAEVVGMDQTYADRTTQAWWRHKTGDDYWTPFLDAQTIELRVALQDPAYPNKPRGGQSGYGSLATRYLVGVELHDMHETEAWEEAIRVMTPYYRQILQAHRE